MLARIAVVACLFGSATAAAQNSDSDVPIAYDTHGIELVIPRNWGTIDNKDGSLILRPTHFNGRGVEVASLKSMPTTRDELYRLAMEDAKGAKLVLDSATLVERNGVHAMIAAGKLSVDGLALDIDVVVLPVATGATVVVSYLKGEQDPMLREQNDRILASARLAGPKLSVTYTRPLARDINGAPRDIVAAIEKIAGFLDNAIALPRPLPIRFEQCDVINAYYSPRDHSIRMCHELFDYLRDLAVKAHATPQQVHDFVAGTAIFVFLHEFGHALVGELGLPVTGKGEDDADEIATIFLIASGTIGENAALAAASWFAVESKQPDHRDTFWDEHSYDVQRTVAIMCLLYGSAPKKYAPTMKQMGIPDDRLAKCTRDYTDRYNAWNALLEPFRRLQGKK